MTAAAGRSRMVAPLLIALMMALSALVTIPARFVTADATSVTISKTTNASGDQSPGASYRYTITAVANDAVDGLIVADGAFDYPQIAVDSVTFTKNGVGPNACGSPRPDNIRCPVGSVAAGTTIVVTVDVTVNSNVDVACDKPGAHGTLDSSVFNVAKASWTQAGVSYARESSRVTVRLDCTGYDPSAKSTPTTTILTGPSATTTKDSATFTFTASPGPVSYKCALDGGSFASCASPKTYTGLALGKHTFEVQAINSSGPGVPASRDWSAVSPFTDIGSSGFKNDIFWLYNRGITAGCSATTFCPRSSVTREQMASFLVRALKLPATSTDFFRDDESSPHESDINRLAASGITGGCASGRFCPKALVTREQMASFLARAFRLPVASIDYFSDDNGSIHQGDINRLAKSGITGGCGTGTFCPKATVTREQMAAFLHRAL